MLGVAPNAPWIWSSTALRSAVVAAGSTRGSLDIGSSPLDGAGCAGGDSVWRQTVRLGTIRRRFHADRTRHVPGSPRRRTAPLPGRGGAVPRSEEHTSELQSLMRISYAVFCL